MTTRERKLDFIRSFGLNTLEDAVARMLVIEGPSFLSNQQLDEVTSLVVRTERAKLRRMLRGQTNRQVS